MGNAAAAAAMPPIPAWQLIGMHLPGMPLLRDAPWCQQG